MTLLHFCCHHTSLVCERNAEISRFERENRGGSEQGKGQRKGQRAKIQMLKRKIQMLKRKMQKGLIKTEGCLENKAESAQTDLENL